MKTQAVSPARAACAATAFARLSVDAQPIVSSPKAAAALIPAATTRSVNGRAGWQTVSFFTHARATPSRRASAGDSTSGVNPLSSESTGSPSNGSHSLYRQSEGARAAIVARSGSGRPGSYTGSSGPRHSSQIASGAAGRSAPQLRQRSGRAVSGGEAMVAGIVSLNRKTRATTAAGGRFLAPCLTWRQYAANHHETSVVGRKS